jgi:hypothetical protein
VPPALGVARPVEDGEHVAAVVGFPSLSWLAPKTACDAWSNEGLFTFRQGLRRLKQIGGDRVDIPAIEWEVRL